MKPIEVIIPVPSERVQFSKELYDANPTGWKVEDTKGNIVRVLCTDGGNKTFPIVWVDNTGNPRANRENGLFTAYGTPSDYDLFMRPVDSGVSKDRYINLYDDTGYKNESDANECALSPRIALLHIKFVTYKPVKP